MWRLTTLDLRQSFISGNGRVKTGLITIPSGDTYQISNLDMDYKTIKEFVTNQSISKISRY